MTCIKAIIVLNWRKKKKGSHEKTERTEPHTLGPHAGCSLHLDFTCEPKVVSRVRNNFIEVGETSLASLNRGWARPCTCQALFSSLRSGDARRICCIASAPLLRSTTPTPKRCTRARCLLPSGHSLIICVITIILHLYLQGDSRRTWKNRQTCQPLSSVLCTHAYLCFMLLTLWGAPSDCFLEDSVLSHSEWKPNYCILQPLSYKCALKEGVGGWWRENMKIFLTVWLGAYPLLPSEVFWQTNKSC